MILQDEDRRKLLKTLELAPDDVLLRAVHDYMGQRTDCERLWESVRGFSGAKPPKLDIPPPPKPSEKYVAPQTAAVSENTEPPGEAPSRIGGDTREQILACCRKPKTLEDVAKFIKRKPAVAAGLCKLLWSRDELTYDGECYRAA